MVDFKNAVNEVKRMANAQMSFGHYGASLKKMRKVYNEGETTQHTHDHFRTGILTESTLYSGKRKSGAVADKHMEANRVNYGIYDRNTGRTYSSGWQDAEKPDKLNFIAFNGFAIEDTNRNGKVDNGDKVYANNASGDYMFVKDLLSGDFSKILNDNKQ